MATEEKKDESLSLTMSEEALAHAFRLRAEKEELKNLGLRLYLDGKGCDGFYYGISFDDESEEDFACVFSDEKQSLRLITDEKTLEFVNGSHIAWSEHEGKEGFLVENPKHKRFRGKFYLRGFWKKKLEAAPLS